MNISVNFVQHDQSVRFADADTLAFFREVGVVRGRNVQTAAMVPVARRALSLAQGGVPCLADWQQAMREVGPVAVCVEGYGVRS